MSLDAVSGHPDEPTLSLSFTIEGEPRSKARARANSETGRHYTPAATREAQVAMGWGARAAHPGLVPLGKPSEFLVEAEFHAGTRQRRDVDNMMKLVLDGLNKVVWDDDCQVTKIVGEIIFNAERPRTEVRISTRPSQDRSFADCQHCDKRFWVSASVLGKMKFCSAACREADSLAKRGRTCHRCGASFLTDRPGTPGTYCSKACASAQQTMTCPTCGEDFSVPVSQVKKRRFCSRSCVRRPDLAARNLLQRPGTREEQAELAAVTYLASFPVGASAGLGEIADAIEDLLDPPASYGLVSAAINRSEQIERTSFGMYALIDAPLETP